MKDKINVFGSHPESLFVSDITDKKAYIWVTLQFLLKVEVGILMIDGQDYEVFVWIRDNVAEKYDRAILDPWKATAFTAITRKHVYTRIHEFAKPSDDEAYEFLSDNCTDTAFLRENGISIVYTGDECNNPSLLKVRQNVYLLEE